MFYVLALSTEDEIFLHKCAKFILAVSKIEFHIKFYMALANACFF